MFPSWRDQQPSKYCYLFQKYSKYEVFEYTVRRAEGDYIDPCHKQKESDIYKKFWNKIVKECFSEKIRNERERNS